MAETPALSVRDLVVREGERVLLSLPALDLAPGTTLGIRGPSGAGKSTLLFALAGLDARATGQVLWGGLDLLALRGGGRAAFRARRMGIVFQDFLLFDELDALGNASVSTLYRTRGDRAPLKARAGALLERLGVPDGRRAVPTLSGGERQRVAVARALAHGPDILLADEPTANLHREAAEALAGDLLAAAAGPGKVLVAVSHDEALLARMDRVIALKDGTLADA
ncbi:ABC transporter ATP-binding protein [Oceaniglobus roseus]|uniref:ABC transporter ATP-binding protein n=1 Tax=Oceaniglobus roseus TaxID=1737570 RepID=UPI000C7F066C|nr:ATP-binding cassette domain-containing protein [Kandeliimicrobium roseum]